MVELSEEFDLSSGPSFHVFTVKSSFEAFLRTQHCPLPPAGQVSTHSSFVYPIKKRHTPMWSILVTPGLELEQGVIEAVLTVIEKEGKLRGIVTIVHWFQITDEELVRTLTQFYQVIFKMRRTARIRIFPRSDERLKQIIDSLQASSLPRLDLQDYGIPEIVGYGGNASVHLVKHKQTDDSVILKIINRASLADEQRKYLDREIAITLKFSELKYERIFVKQLYQSFVDSENRQIIPLEFCAGGTLLRHIANSTTGVHLPMDEIRRIIYQVSTALRHMHSYGIAHRDLKADNVLLTSEIVREADVKICDFGLSKELGNEVGTNVVGRQERFAPEANLEQGMKYDCNVDVWYLGLLTDDLVYGIKNYIQIYPSAEAVKTRVELRGETWELPPEEVNEFIFQLRQRKETRLNIGQVLESQFLHLYKEEILKKLNQKLRNCKKEFDRNKVLAEDQGVSANDWIRETQETILQCRTEVKDLEVYDWAEVPVLQGEIQTLLELNENLLNE